MGATPPRLKPTPRFPRLDRNNAVDVKLTIPAPGDGTEIFRVMQLHLFASGQLQLYGHLLVLDRKRKLVGLKGIRSFGLKSRLDQLALIGLEDIPLPHHVIQRSGFYAITKIPVIPIVEKETQHQDHRGQENGKEFFHSHPYLSTR